MCAFVYVCCRYMKNRAEDGAVRVKEERMLQRVAS